MGNHRQITALLTPARVSATVPASRSTTTCLPIPEVLRASLEDYQTRWAWQPQDLQYPEGQGLPSHWVSTHAPWVELGITPKEFYRDPESHTMWMQKKNDPSLWKEVASHQVLDILGLPHVPVFFTHPDDVNDVVQPMWEGVDTVGQAVQGNSDEGIPMSHSDQVASVMHLVGQWMVSHRDGHTGNFLATPHGSGYSVMPIDYGKAWDNGFDLDTPEIDTRIDAFNWLKRGLKGQDWQNSNLLQIWAYRGVYRDITNSEWEAMEDWANTIHEAPSDTWDAVIATGHRASVSLHTRAEQQMQTILAERQKFVPHCVQALRKLSQF